MYKIIFKFELHAHAIMDMSSKYGGKLALDVCTGRCIIGVAEFIQPKIYIFPSGLARRAIKSMSLFCVLRGTLPTEALKTPTAQPASHTWAAAETADT